jgi:hypothetical protein
VEKGWIEELERDDLDVTVADVIFEIRAINRAAPMAARLNHSIGIANADPILAAIDERMAAIAEAIAIRASDSHSVRSWRHRRLQGQLLDGSKVTSWIDEMYRRYLPKDWPADGGPATATNFAGAFVHWPHPYIELEWVDEVPAVRVWCVPENGPLGELAKLVGKLAREWDWDAGLATKFVLTGETPPRPGIRQWTYRNTTGWDNRHGTYDYLAVQGCSIDFEVTPEELAAWWRMVRTNLGASGRKPIGTKSTRLAQFVMSRPNDTTNRQNMEAWNAQATPEWHFSDWRNFRTAASKAVAALNYPAENYGWHRRGEKQADAE